MVTCGEGATPPDRRSAPTAGRCHPRRAAGTPLCWKQGLWCSKGLRDDSPLVGSLSTTVHAEWPRLGRGRPQPRLCCSCSRDQVSLALRTIAEPGTRGGTGRTWAPSPGAAGRAVTSAPRPDPCQGPMWFQRRPGPGTVAVQVPPETPAFKGFEETMPDAHVGWAVPAGRRRTALQPSHRLRGPVSKSSRVGTRGFDAVTSRGHLQAPLTEARRVPGFGAQ